MRLPLVPDRLENLSSSASAAPLVKLHEVTTNIGKGRGGGVGVWFVEQILFLKICRNGKDSTADHNVSFKVLVHSQTSAQRPPRGHKKMAVVERFKQESMYGLSAKKSGRY